MKSAPIRAGSASVGLTRPSCSSWGRISLLQWRAETPSTGLRHPSFSYAIGCRKLSANEQFVCFCWCSNNWNCMRRLFYNWPCCWPAQIKPKSFESRRNSLFTRGGCADCQYVSVSSSDFQVSGFAALAGCNRVQQFCCSRWVKWGPAVLLQLVGEMGSSGFAAVGGWNGVQRFCSSWWWVGSGPAVLQ